MQKFIYIFYINLIFFVFLDANQQEYVVQTSSGITSGEVKKKVLIWNDIPYAKPPINDLRWKAPQSVDNPNQILLNKNNNFCIQEPSYLGGVDSDKSIVGSEDCLYLDIRSPKNNFKNQLLPVMFWIHGGGNTSGLKDIYDFSNFVRKNNVIVVSINYRLGPFGWFYHPEIQSNQNGLDKTSNFGTLDIISALKWTKKNIQKFGGDPNNVTIFGESAGGHNVLSLLVSSEAKGLFHKAISQSGYTTSISPTKAYKQNIISNTSKSTSSKLVEYLLKGDLNNAKDLNIRKLLVNTDGKKIFQFYIDKSNQDIPLLTSDGIIIPKIGLKNALSNKNIVNKVPTIIGSNKDEVKLWLGTATYFVDLEYSFFGDILNIPRVVLKDKKSFEAFNYYRSLAWQIRGVIEPAKSLSKAGNNDLYIYRYDWDDHRNFLIADFKELFGAAHATEIPLISGDYNLVGEFSFLIYPKGPSKRFTSKNMMRFWSNFAYEGTPGKSTNDKEWSRYIYNKTDKHNLMVIDNKSNLGMEIDGISFKKLINELNLDERLNEIEKCVVYYQVTTFVGEDLFEDYKKFFSTPCTRSAARTFIVKNSSYIDF